MPFYLAFLGIVCAATIKEDRFNRPWTENDQWMLENAQKGCKEHFEGRSPCLKRFIKLEGFQDYQAICGGKLNGNQQTEN